ncbi:hypothetical protein BT63DRAFT_404605 [Microthyrium microscopicum]|uniref:Uncharacterized protein n=1 Tax=Microthyrium microscopicum TaxID=703497 RepID=A0A6A6U4N7_9PEZI|nr:hypothetical protein BT63DRAFT_404605 [Microthyrium microscopicum]
MTSKTGATRGRKIISALSVPLLASQSSVIRLRRDRLYSYRIFLKRQAAKPPRDAPFDHRPEVWSLQRGLVSLSPQIGSYKLHKHRAKFCSCLDFPNFVPVNLFLNSCLPCHYDSGALYAQYLCTETNMSLLKQLALHAILIGVIRIGR